VSLAATCWRGITSCWAFRWLRPASLVRTVSQLICVFLQESSFEKNTEVASHIWLSNAMLSRVAMASNAAPAVEVYLAPAAGGLRGVAMASNAAPAVEVGAAAVAGDGRRRCNGLQCRTGGGGSSGRDSWGAPSGCNGLQCHTGGGGRKTRSGRCRAIRLQWPPMPHRRWRQTIRIDRARADQLQWPPMPHRRWRFKRMVAGSQSSLAASPPMRFGGERKWLRWKRHDLDQLCPISLW
jgi:hypothetical protein